MNKRLMTPVRGIDLVKVVNIGTSEVKAITGAHLVIDIGGKIVYLVMIEINMEGEEEEILAMIERKIPNERKGVNHQYLREGRIIMKKKMPQLKPKEYSLV